MNVISNLFSSNNQAATQSPPQAAPQDVLEDVTNKDQQMQSELNLGFLSPS